MLMSQPIRKLTLTAHVVSSIGWVGALAVFLAHSIVSVASPDVQLVRTAGIAMALTTWCVILPLSVASLVTGLLQAWGTAWGLLQHYWVVIKLLLTLVATAVLLLKLAPIDALSTAASTVAFSTSDLLELKTSLLVHAAAGLFLLLVATALAVYKPAGLTSRGAAILRRRGAGAGDGNVSVARWPRWVRQFAAIGLLALLAVLAMLLFGGHGPSAHVP
jgi:hypothetical protein